MNRIKTAIKKTLNTMWGTIPILVGTILLISIARAVIPKSVYTALFSGNMLVDPLIGSILGSILSGNPITSYILGGEFLIQGVSLLAVTAFLVSWVTVGLIQLPAESMLLGKRFAIVRNITSFVSSILVAILTVIGVNLL